MRGTRSGSDATIASSRIIPAHAGNSDPTERSASCSTDHPRACGELSMMVFRAASTDGSSPRMRGTPANNSENFESPRIIPAHAGNSAARRPSWDRCPDHPRACGELSGDHPRGPAGAGSSPRMRGTPAYRPRPPILLRIIPAHAGNSGVRGGAYVLESDHPRACGELSWNEETPAWETGSSPRMRGTHPAVRVTHNLARIIPAHAGNSLAGIVSVRRTCGSSPRMRVTRLSNSSRRGYWRIIPAHAGNSRARTDRHA